MSGINTGAFPARAGSGSATIATVPIDEITDVISLEEYNWLILNVERQGIYTLQFLPSHIDANAPVIESIQVSSTPDAFGNYVDFYQSYPNIYDTFFYGTYTLVFNAPTILNISIFVGLSVATPNVIINATDVTIIRLGDA